MELGAEVNIRCQSPQVGTEVIPCRTSIAPRYFVYLKLRFCWDSQQSYYHLLVMVRLVMWLLNMKNSCNWPLEIKIHFSNTYMNVKKTAYFMTCCSTTGQMIFNKLLIVSIEFSFNILIRYIKKCCILPV